MFIIVILVLQLLLLVYHQLTTLLDFYPFNNVRSYSARERIRESLIHGILMVIPPLGFGLEIAELKIIGAIYYGLLLLGEWQTWWYPYFFGTGTAGADWQAQYNRIFQHTVIILPSIKNHPVPNLEHLILHSLTLVTAVATWLSWIV